MKIYSAIFLTTALVCILSCNKEEQASISISGTVTDKYNGQAASGVSVEVSAQELSSGTYSSAYNRIFTTTTDASGNYSQTFDAPNAIEYKMEVSKSELHTSERIINPDSWSKTNNNLEDFTIAGKAWFRVHIKNVSPWDTLDRVVYQTNADHPECPACCNNNHIDITGLFIDTVLTCETYSNQVIDVSYIVTKHFVPTTYTNSITTVAGDTVSMNVHY
jgi:hypothetical protein